MPVNKIVHASDSLLVFVVIKDTNWLIYALIIKDRVKTTSIVKKSSDDVKELTNHAQKNESYFILFYIGLNS